MIARDLLDTLKIHAGRQFRFAWTMLVLLPVGFGACGARAGGTPSDVVMQFYAMRDALGVQGAPDASELKALTPFIADTLARVLARADAQRAEDMRRAPDEKPAFVEGDLFSSLFEGPTKWRALTPIEGATTALVPVEFTYDRERPTVQWIDTVEVVRESDHWVVRDIRYGGTWDFAQRGALLSGLLSALGGA